MPTFTAKPGLYVGDDTHGAVEMTQQWVRDSVTVIGTGSSHTTQSPDDDGALIEYVEQAGNSAGLMERRVVAQAEAFPITVQFRDSALLVSDDFTSLRPFGPSASYTRAMTVALRFSGITSGNDADAHVGVITPQGVLIQNNRFNAVNRRLQIQARLQNFSFLGAAITPLITDNTPFTLSLIAAVDYDAGLPGGEVFVVWGSIDGGAWARLGGHSTAPASGTETLEPVNVLGSGTTAAVGKTFDLHHWIWAHDAALDPATHWQHFFNADGTVKNLGPTGVVAGVTPRLYMKGFDFQGSGATLVNRGSQGSVARYRTPLALVLP
jgi:hypothetical protein